MKLVVYADESGTHDDSEYSLVGGWIAPEKAWEQFNPLWQAVLDKYKIDFFHFNDLARGSFNRRNPQKRKPDTKYSKMYEHLSDSDVDDLLDDLASVMKNLNMEFEYAIFEKQKFLTQQADPKTAKVYDKDFEFYLVEHFIDRAASRILEVWGGGFESLQFVFDDRNNTEWRKAINFVMGEFKRFNWKVESVLFRTCDKALPIQAADLLAYKGLQIHRNVHRCKFPTKPTVLDSILAKRVQQPDGWKSRTQPYVETYRFDFPL